MNNILAVITQWEDAPAVLNRAESLAGKFNTSVEVLRPLHAPLGSLSHYFGPNDILDVRKKVLAEERNRLDELCGERRWPLHLEWCERVHTTIVERAHAYSAGLIVMMASHHSVLSTLAHTPDDWHLFRESPCPVLTLVRVGQPITKVIAAVDVLDHSEDHQQLSARVIDQARAMAQAEDVPFTVLSVVPDPALLYAGLVNGPVGGDILIEIKQRAGSDLGDMLKRLGVSADRVEVKAGRVEDVVNRESADGGLLVIGCAANRGVKGLLIGNTAERILHNMQSDMLVVV